MNQYFVIFITQCPALHYKNSLILFHIFHHLNLIPYYFLIPKSISYHTNETQLPLSHSKIPFSNRNLPRRKRHFAVSESRLSLT